MDYYLDIKVVPDDDIPLYFIRNKVYAKLHKALCTMESTDIGVSFPKCRVKLGDVIRIHGAKQRLDGLQAMNWLGGLSGYCEVSDILPVPGVVKYRVVSRKQPTMTLKKLEERVVYQKSKGILKTDEDIKNYRRQYKEKMYASSLDNPYLELQSSSNDQRYRIFIQIGDPLESNVAGSFNQFGLSQIATIPWF